MNPRPPPPPGYKYTRKGRLAKAGWGGSRPGSGRNRRTQAPQPASRRSRRNQPSGIPQPRDTNRPVASNSRTTALSPSEEYAEGDVSGENTLITGNGSSGIPLAALHADSQQTRRADGQTQRLDPSLLTCRQLNSDLSFVEENDEHGDIASGLWQIDESLVDQLLSTIDGAATAQTETADSSQQFLEMFKRRILIEIETFGMPLCYQRGQFLDQPMHPVFAIARDAAHSSPNCSYPRDVFVWLPHLLPGHPDKFKCMCGLNLERCGYNDDPIARRVRRLPIDYFLFTSRFWCDGNREESPGCNEYFQGTDPHIIAQLPRFVQEGFPAYISARGALDKQMAWQMCSGVHERPPPSLASQDLASPNVDRVTTHPEDQPSRIAANGLTDANNISMSDPRATPELDLPTQDADADTDNSTDHTDVHYSPYMVPAHVAAQFQTTLQLNGTLITIAQTKGDRCAVCVKAYCRQRWSCAGKGNRTKCTCGHPPLRNGERVRGVTEEMIEAFLAAQVAEQR